jgi:serine/threonine protein kinase
MHTLLDAVKTIHNNDIVHRDLKFNNIMFNSQEDDLVFGGKITGYMSYLFI